MYRRDPRKKPNIDVGLLNKRDPRRKNVTTEATKQQTGFHQGVFDVSKPAYAAQLLANQVANLKECIMYMYMPSSTEIL